MRELPTSNASQAGTWVVLFSLYNRVALSVVGFTPSLSRASLTHRSGNTLGAVMVLPVRVLRLRDARTYTPYPQRTNIPSCTMDRRVLSTPDREPPQPSNSERRNATSSGRSSRYFSIAFLILDGYTLTFYCKITHVCTK